MIASTSSIPVISSETTRAKSATKRTSAVGHSSSFLTALATQERRVLELREELQKAEDDLSRLRKQWATYEAIKKRNEFRHREQLQNLGPASRFTYEEDRKRVHERTSEDSSGSCSAGLDGGPQPAHRASEENVSCRVSKRQPQRRIFSGSRHTKTLSLLSKVGTSSHTPGQVLQEPISQALQSSTGTSLKRSQTLNARPPLDRITINDSTSGQPKEVFLETGKQLVGDLREGLWTFFEDLRQATVGEEASSSSPIRVNKVGQVTRPHGGRRTGTNHAPVSNFGDEPFFGAEIKEELVTMDQPVKVPIRLPSKTSDTATATLKQQLTNQLARINEVECQSNNSHQGSVNQTSNWDDDDPWDTWDSPVAKDAASRRQAGSVTSESVVSPSTRRESPRSSLSSFDATIPALQSNVSTEKPKDIPWPVLTKLSPDNMRMTASILMSEWEKTLAQSATIDSAGAISPSTTQEHERMT
ncbi:MAG: hypothetical protein Q9224_002239 [Gallowayella concinna]